jgi:hypothetical protein
LAKNYLAANFALNSEEIACFSAGKSYISKITIVLAAAKAPSKVTLMIITLKNRLKTITFEMNKRF